MILKYDEHGQPYEDLTEENKKLTNRIKELDNSLSIALDINDKYQRDNKKLKEKTREAEGETSIVKAIGTNSPEMRAAQARIKELEEKCREAGRAMIELNVKYEANIKELDRLSEENTNIKIMKDDGKSTSNNS
tara:strand:- start:169 stop:570 length:402 start_codon:yes stop_codon:yes gene_type:complete